MFTQNEPFLSAEVDYRRERALQAMSGRRQTARSGRSRRPHRARTLALRFVAGH